MASRELNILDLPSEILELVFKYSSYDEVASYRLVCQKFNEISKTLLTQGFGRVDRFHAHVQKDVKSKLPRRESERRNHPLAKHVNVLSSVETRLSLLSMTFTKYIDMSLCCFIPGKVLDELLRVLHAVSKPDLQPRAHELLQELRDISSMAMEHFDEKIVPRLKVKMQATPSTSYGSPGCSTSSPECTGCVLTPPSTIRPPAVRQELMQLRQSMRNNSSVLSNLKREMSGLKGRSDADKASGLEQGKRLVELGRGLSELQKQVNGQETQFSELNRRMEEQDQKMIELWQEMAQIKDSMKITDEETEETGTGDSKSSRKRKATTTSSPSTCKKTKPE